jgi:uncharacterized protein (DUF58 family)
VLAAGAFAWVSAAAGSTALARLPGPARVEEGDAYPLRVRIRRRVPLPPAELIDPLLERGVAVGSRGPAMVSLALRFERRGRHSLAPPRLRLADPLGLYRRGVAGRGDGGELLVLPRTEEVRRADPAAGGRDANVLDGLEHGAEGAGIETGAVDLEIDGLRPYREGSPASRIHWRTVARSGEMYERRFVAGADAAPLVVLDASGPADAEALDRAVRAAASLCLHLARRGGCAILLADQAVPTLVDPRLRTWPEVHARLALVEAGTAVPWPRQAAGRIASFWVSGADARSAARTGVRTMPGSHVVTPFPTPEAPVAFTVAGCSGQRASRAVRGSGAGRRAAA